MALNTPLYECGDELSKAAAERVTRRRGKADVGVTLHRFVYEDKTGVALQINGKTATRKVESAESAWRSIDEMIEELWPLALEPLDSKARSDYALAKKE